jgi:hypothetical protein
MKVIFKQSTIPFYIKIVVDGQEILERHDISFSQGALIEATLGDIDGDPIIEYEGMFAYFNEETMEVLDLTNIGRVSCCG